MSLINCGSQSVATRSTVETRDPRTAKICFVLVRVSPSFPECTSFRTELVLDFSKFSGIGPVLF